MVSEKLNARRPRIAIAAIGMALLATAITLWAYQPALEGGFVLDDATSIVDNPAVQWESVSWQGAKSVFESARLRRRWVANFSFALNHVAGGLDPSGYHLVNLWIHLAVGGALAFLIWLYLKSAASEHRPWVMVAATALPVLLFLLHPLNTQAVSYVVQRMASLVALFVLLSIACYVAGRTRTVKGPSWLWFLGSVVFLVLGLGTKQNAALVPLVLFVYEGTVHGAFWRGHLRKIWAGPLFGRVSLVAGGVLALLVGTMLLRLYVGYSPFRFLETYPTRDYNGIERVLTQLRVQWLYLGLLVWPLPGRLNLDYDYVVSRGLLTPPTTLAALVSLLLLLGAVVFLAVKKPVVGFPLISYFVLHSAEAGPVNLELVFEHRMYLPMTMLAVALAVVLTEMRSTRRRSAVCAVLAAVAVLLAGATRARNHVWADPVLLAEDVVRKSPLKPRALANLGAEYGIAGRPQEAELVLLRALELDPDNSKTHYALGLAYLDLGRPEDALVAFQKAERLNPGAIRPTYEIGSALKDMGRLEEAFRYYLDLGTRLGMEGRIYQAIPALERAVAIDSTSSAAHNALGNAYQMAGIATGALREYRTAVELDGVNLEALYNLARQLDREGEPSAALEYYRRFVELAPPQLAEPARIAEERIREIEAGRF